LITGFRHDISEIWALLGFTQRITAIQYRRFGKTYGVPTLRLKQS